MEIWDLLDGNRQPLGVTHPRGLAHPLPAGAYHLAVTVLTVDRDGQLLVTRRAPTKRMYPGYWEVTAGSVVAGEDSVTGAYRELAEETGITRPESEWVLLGSLREPTAFMDVYLCRTTAPAADLPVTLQEGETVDFRWVSFSEFDGMLHEGLIPPPVAYRYGAMRARLAEVLGQGERPVEVPHE